MEAPWPEEPYTKPLKVWHQYHTSRTVKMTLHIDDGLLARAMKVAGVESKTAAVDLALREFVRRSELVRTLSTGLKLEPEELGNLFDPAYDLEALRRADQPVPYGRKPRSRR